MTWMDVKIGDRVVAPRHGKPVVISALWYNVMSGSVLEIFDADPPYFPEGCGALSWSVAEVVRARQKNATVRAGIHIEAADHALTELASRNTQLTEEINL